MSNIWLEMVIKWPFTSRQFDATPSTIRGVKFEKKSFGFGKKKFGSDTGTDTFGRYRNRYRILVLHYDIPSKSMGGTYKGHTAQE